MGMGAVRAEQDSGPAVSVRQCSNMSIQRGDDVVRPIHIMQLSRIFDLRLGGYLVHRSWKSRKGGMGSARSRRHHSCRTISSEVSQRQLAGQHSLSFLGKLIPSPLYVSLRIRG